MTKTCNDKDKLCEAIRRINREVNKINDRKVQLSLRTLRSRIHDEYYKTSINPLFITLLEHRLGSLEYIT